MLIHPIILVCKNVIVKYNGWNWKAIPKHYGYQTIVDMIKAKRQSTWDGAKMPNKIHHGERGKVVSGFGNTTFKPQALYWKLGWESLKQAPLKVVSGIGYHFETSNPSFGNRLPSSEAMWCMPRV